MTSCTYIFILSICCLCLFFLIIRRPPRSTRTDTLFPYTTLFRPTALGWLPAQLGFALPSEAMIRASDGLQQLPGSAQALWSSWLIGCVVVYGLLPDRKSTRLNSSH